MKQRLHIDREDCKRCINDGRKRMTDSQEFCVLECLPGVHRICVPVFEDGSRIGSIATQLFRNSEELPSLTKLAHSVRTPARDPVVNELSNELAQLPYIEQAKYDAMIHLLSVFAKNLVLLHQEDRLKAQRYEPPAVRKAKAIVCSHSERAVSTRETAQAVGMSCQHFCRVFKDSTGMTFQQFVTRWRIEQAKQLLLNQDKRVTDVAFESGFNSIPHFNRMFRREVGLAPLAYRKAKRGAQSL